MSTVVLEFALKHSQDTKEYLIEPCNDSSAVVYGYSGRLEWIVKASAMLGIRRQVSQWHI